MYDLININGFIILTPQEFNNDWKSTLAEKKKYLGCTNSYGYIIKITKFQMILKRFSIVIVFQSDVI